MYSDIELELAEKDSIIENLQHKLDNVERLMAAWMHYAHMSGQTGRLIGEVRDVVNGVPVMAGTEWIQ